MIDNDSDGSRQGLGRRRRTRGSMAGFESDWGFHRSVHPSLYVSPVLVLMLYYFSSRSYLSY